MRKHTRPATTVMMSSHVQISDGVVTVTTSRMKPRADNTRAAMNMSSWMCWCRQGPVAPQDSARSSAGANQWLPGPVGTGPGSRVYYVEERSPRGMPLIPGQIRSGILTTGVVAGVARRCGGTTCVEFLQLALEE